MKNLIEFFSSCELADKAVIISRIKCFWFRLYEPTKSFLCRFYRDVVPVCFWGFCLFVAIVAPFELYDASSNTSSLYRDIIIWSGVAVWAGASVLFVGYVFKKTFCKEV